MTAWTAEAVEGVDPRHWRIRREGETGRPLVFSGTDEQVMHVLEALNAYERPVLHAVTDCAEVHGVSA